MIESAKACAGFDLLAEKQNIIATLYGYIPANWQQLNAKLCVIVCIARGGGSQDVAGC